MSLARGWTGAASLLAACALTACGGDGEQPRGGAPASAPPAETGSAGRDESSRQRILSGIDGFDPQAVYSRTAGGVVTVISIFGSGDSASGGQGSGFVLNDQGEIATNAHVVTEGEGGSVKPAREVFVEFADRNRAAAEIVGFDPNADVALLRVEPDGLELEPLALGSSRKLEVGQPVAAIGSPFGEEQSLSVGVVSATGRSIESLTAFQINDAIQTDAAINRGNSGGPLLDVRGRVIGMNQQIKSSSGGGEGVGFAVPIDAAKRSIEQLRESGQVEYAYLGVSSQALYPQLAERLDLPVRSGALIAEVVDGGPADRAGVREGKREIRFQGSPVKIGGDVIVSVAGRRLVRESDLSAAIASRRPGDRVELELIRDGRRRTLRARLGKRPRRAPER